MRLITGDECGLLKECVPERSLNPRDKGQSDEDDDEHLSLGPKNAMQHVALDGVRRIDAKEFQSRKRSIIDMTFTSDEDVTFASLRKNGSIEMWEGSSESSNSFGKYTRTFESKNVFSKIIENSESSAWKPLALGAFKKDSRLCASDSLGNLSIVHMISGKVVDSFFGYAKSKGGKTISYTPGKFLNEDMATAMACDTNRGWVALGGRERETTLLDLATGKVTFKTKNLPPDPQTLLQHPVWPTAIEFLQDCNTMAVGTAYKELRLYDVRESSKTRRPISRTTTEGGPIEYRVTSLCQVSDYELAVGDAAGYIYSIDMRTLGSSKIDKVKSNNMGRYTGPAGSVRQMKKHPTLPRLATVGLDRMLRVYDTKTRNQVDCFYLKQRLNCVLFSGEHEDLAESFSVADGDEVDIEGIDEDDIVQDYVDSD